MSTSLPLKQQHMQVVDVAVIGGGAAGLAAGLYLGRALLRTFIIDAGQQRIKPAAHAHAFLGREGATPSELYETGRKQLSKFNSVTIFNDVVCNVNRVTNAEYDEGVPEEAMFEISTEKGLQFYCSRIILATSVQEYLPDIKGLRELWGTSVVNSPFSRGYEVRGQPAAILATSPEIIESLTPLVYNWHKDVVVLTNGLCDDVREETKRILAAHNVNWVKTPIDHLEIDTRGWLSQVVFTDGKTVDRSVIYAQGIARLNGNLHEQLGCALNDKGYLKTDPKFQSTVPGVYVAGDALGIQPPQLVAAAFTGSMAALCVCQDLTKERFGFASK